MKASFYTDYDRGTELPWCVVEMRHNGEPDQVVSRWITEQAAEQECAEACALGVSQWERICKVRSTNTRGYTVEGEGANV